MLFAGVVVADEMKDVVLDWENTIPEEPQPPKLKPEEETKKLDVEDLQKICPSDESDDEELD